MFQNTFKDKRVVVTGHTGFKGSWLVAWLKILGANVTGISNNIPTNPSHYEAANIYDGIDDKRIDICDLESLKMIITNFQPEYVFHLAAQPLVRESYENPIQTYRSNVIGTLNMLEALRELKSKCAAVFITSDKCYDNVEWEWGYRENDTLGGPDPYSASKGAAEIIIKSHIKSFFSSDSSFVRIASARAGNVIGGGDWAEDRIIPDCVKSWSQSKEVKLRNPSATRPWQHVLEPLSGYLALAQNLNSYKYLHGEPFNFGPVAIENQSVLELVKEMSKNWDEVKFEDISSSVSGPYESGLLKLNCDKALYHLKWKAVMNFEDTVRMTSEWYRVFYEDSEKSYSTTINQINEYMSIAKDVGMKWTK
jgi:CDP-glucose 4,6-dehydratase